MDAAAQKLVLHDCCAAPHGNAGTHGRQRDLIRVEATEDIEVYTCGEKERACELYTWQQNVRAAGL